PKLQQPMLSATIAACGSPFEPNQQPQQPPASPSPPDLPPIDPKHAQHPVWRDYFKAAPCGRGVYGKVYRGVRRADGRVVAVKKTKLDPVESVAASSLREVRALKLLAGHPFVVELNQHITSKAVWLVLEYADEDLQHYIRQARNPLPAFVIKHITFQLLLVLLHAHTLRLAHRDLKPPNVMLRHDANQLWPTVRVIDFGLSRVCPVPIQPLTPEVQTVIYRAPEVFFQTKRDVLTEAASRLPKMGRFYSGSVDVWSVGCIMAGATEIDVIKKIIGTLGPIPPQLAGTPIFAGAAAVSVPAPERARLALRGQVARLEPAGVRLLETSFRGRRLRQAMLEYDPRRRVAPLAAVMHDYFAELRAVPVYAQLLAPYDALRARVATNAETKAVAVASLSAAAADVAGGAGGGGCGAAAVATELARGLASPASLLPAAAMRAASMR
ncbi:hypothetical protein HK405_007132, partial [Cladochytrium tenue]